MGDDSAARLLELARRCEEADSASFALEQEIALALGEKDWPPLNYTASLDAALTLVPDGCGYLIGAGRTRPDEPLYGALVTSMDGTVTLGSAETEAGLALATCSAALRARAALATPPATGREP